MPLSAAAESIRMTGMCASQAFLIAGISASGSEGASTIAATFRLTAFSTSATCPARSVSDAAPWKLLV